MKATSLLLVQELYLYKVFLPLFATIDVDETIMCASRGLSIVDSIYDQIKFHSETEEYVGNLNNLPCDEDTNN